MRSKFQLRWLVLIGMPVVVIIAIVISMLMMCYRKQRTHGMIKSIDSNIARESPSIEGLKLEASVMHKLRAIQEHIHKHIHSQRYQRDCKQMLQQAALAVVAALKNRSKPVMALIPLKARGTKARSLRINWAITWHLTYLLNSSGKIWCVDQGRIWEALSGSAVDERELVMEVAGAWGEDWLLYGNVRIEGNNVCIKWELHNIKTEARHHSSVTCKLKKLPIACVHMAQDVITLSTRTRKGVRLGDLRYHSMTLNKFLTEAEAIDLYARFTYRLSSFSSLLQAAQSGELRTLRFKAYENMQRAFGIDFRDKKKLGMEVEKLTELRHFGVGHLYVYWSRAIRQGSHKPSLESHSTWALLWQCKRIEERLVRALRKSEHICPQVKEILILCAQMIKMMPSAPKSFFGNPYTSLTALLTSPEGQLIPQHVITQIWNYLKATHPDISWGIGDK